MKSEMDCPSSEGLIDLFYGELDAIESAHVRQHLARCASCALEWTSLEQTLDLMGALPGGPVTPSVKLETRLLKMVALQRPGWRRVVDRFWSALNSPVPAYKAMMGGAALALVAQLFVSNQEVAQISTSPRPPDPNAMSIRIEPMEIGTPAAPRQELEHSVDAVSTDDYAQAF